MKYFSYFILLLTLLFFYSCKQKKTAINLVSIQKDTSSFYPLVSFIEEQKRYVDVRDFRITRTIKQNTLIKQEQISKEEFASELGVF
ncbi:MAG: hypothetical protein K2X26_13650 [Chitinophagaceae bacterium]|nr:hypothetical protein [Chitinophagaceae bacterium]